MTIDNVIREFAKFLNSAWDIVIPLLLNREYTSNEGALDDWLQANWEFLVEKKFLGINEYLEVYGEGADFNGASSRITDIEAKPKYSIRLKNKENGMAWDILNRRKINPSLLSFNKLVGFQAGFYTLRPKFSYALLINDRTGAESVVSLDEILFELKKI